MADTAEGDTDVQYLGLQVLALIILIAGLLIHSFIIGVNVTDWWKGRSVTPVDHIVTSLGISRMGAQCSVTIYLFVDTLTISLHSTLPRTIGAVYIFFIYTNFWLTSLLSIVLCLKISNLRSRLFLYLRGLIVHRTGYLIGAAVLLSALNCSMPILVTLIDWIREGTSNTTINHPCMDYSNINYLYSFTIGAFFSMIFYCISSVLLFTSLYHHTVKMKKSSNLSINLETYYSVMRFVSFTFIYNTMYFMGQFVGVFYSFFHCLCLHWLYAVLDVLVVLHSSYLIYRTANLRTQMSKVLQNVISLTGRIQKPERT